MEDKELRPQAWDEIFQKEGRVYDKTFPRFDWLVQQFERGGCSRILDLGCGSGRHLLHLSKLGFNVTGVDYSPTGLKMAKQWLDEEGISAPTCLADMRSHLPFSNRAFQGILSTQVIHHTRLATVRKIVDEIWRVLTSDGLAFITVPVKVHDNEEYIQIEPNTFVPVEGLEKGLPHHIFTLKSFRALFEKFQIMEAEILGERVIAILAAKV